MESKSIAEEAREHGNAWYVRNRLKGLRSSNPWKQYVDDEGRLNPQILQDYRATPQMVFANCTPFAADKSIRKVYEDLEPISPAAAGILPPLRVTDYRYVIFTGALTMLTGTFFPILLPIAVANDVPKLMYSSDRAQYQTLRDLGLVVSVSHRPQNMTTLNQTMKEGKSARDVLLQVREMPNHFAHYIGSDGVLSADIFNEILTKEKSLNGMRYSFEKQTSHNKKVTDLLVFTPAAEDLYVSSSSLCVHPLSPGLSVNMSLLSAVFGYSPLVNVVLASASITLGERIAFNVFNKRFKQKEDVVGKDLLAIIEASKQRTVFPGADVHSSSSEGV